MWPDIVRRWQGKTPFAEGFDQVRDQSVTLLSWSWPGSEQEFGTFLTLVQFRVDIEGSAAVHDRILDRLTHCARNTAQYDIDLAVLDQSANVADGDPGIGGGIFKKELDRPADD